MYFLFNAKTFCPQVTNTRKCLVKIGKHIDSLLVDMSEEQGRDWKGSLWLFVSNFTEFDARKLFKLYRHAMKKDGSSQEEKESSQEREEKKEKKEKSKHKKKHKEKNREQRKSTDTEPRQRQEDKKVRVAPPRLEPIKSENQNFSNGDRRDGGYNRDRGYNDRSGYSNTHHPSHHKGGHSRNDQSGGGYNRGGYSNRDNRGYKERSWGNDNYQRWGGERGGGSYREERWRDRGGGYYRGDGGRDSRDGYRDHGDEGYSHGEDPRYNQEDSRSSYPPPQDEPRYGQDEDSRDGSSKGQNDSREEGEIGPDDMESGDMN